MISIGYINIDLTDSTYNVDKKIDCFECSNDTL